MDARWNQDKTQADGSEDRSDGHQPEMIIDCDDCAMQHTKVCDDCVVTALLHITAHPVRLVEAESEALGNLAAVGLVAPLRLVPQVERELGAERSAEAG